MWGLRSLEALMQDVRYGVRVLTSKPSFTAVAALTLALGIGLNAAIFSVVNSVMLRPLPYREPERLVQIWEQDRRGGNERNVISPANFLDWRKQAQSFESFSAYNIWLPSLVGTGEPTQLTGGVVTASFFTTLGVTPQLGRTFAPDEDQPDKNRVVVISHDFWQNRLGGRADVIGQALMLNEDSHTIIGVLRPDYRHPEPFFDQKAELWRPLTLSERTNRSSRYLRAVGRLKPGVNREQAQAELSALARQLEQSYPVTNTNWGASIVPLHEQVTGDVSLTLLVLQGAVAFVLLIACLNVANLLLARVAGREKEIAVRAALGARRSQLVRQLLTESLLLAALGGAAGLLLALWGVDYLVSLAPDDIPRLEDVSLDGRVFGFTLLLSLLTVVVFGLVPAWQGARTDLYKALKDGARSVSGGQGLRGALVVAEIALSLVLLTGAGLMLRSLWRLQNVSLGFNPENLLTMQVDLPASRARENHQIVNFYQEALARLAALPGIESAAVTSTLPLGGLNNTAISFNIVDQPPPEPGKTPTAGYRVISPGYFHTMSIPLIKGRFFTERDAQGATEVVIVNQAFVRRYLSDADPIGRRITRGPNRTPEIVGVVGDFKYAGLMLDPSPELYVPHAQNPWSFVALVVRTVGGPDSLTGAVQKTVWEAEKNAPISRVRTMRQILAEAVSQPRFNVLLLGVFALTALVLAAVGIYGVMSYTVAQNTREIGVRIALGARHSDVLKLVLGRGLLLTAAGIFLGVVGALGLTRLMKSLLFDVSATDPVTLTGVAVVLALVALLACYLPARRAAKVDPMVALRYE